MSTNIYGVKHVDSSINVTLIVLKQLTYNGTRTNVVSLLAMDQWSLLESPLRTQYHVSEPVGIGFVMNPVRLNLNKFIINLQWNPLNY